MIVKRLLAGLEAADSAKRAQGAASLAQAYLRDDLSDVDLLDAETALTALLDDPVIAVRKAMARVLASSNNAPPHIVAALATDHSQVAGRILTHSPLLTEEDLIDALGVADSYAQVSLALRPNLPAKVAAMIAETGEREAMIALAVNESARVDEDTMQQILERHGDDGEVREALLGRMDLPAAVRATIARLTADALERFTTAAGWLSPRRGERCTKEARDTTLIEIAAQDHGDTGSAPLHLAQNLRRTNQLTPSLLLRALVSAERSLFEASLAALTGIELHKVTGLVRAWSGTGFAAVYAKAGLPPRLLGAFRAALAAQDATGLVLEAGEQPVLSSLLIERTLTACEASSSPDLRTVNALLHRLRAEALRNEARIMSMEMISDARSALSIADMSAASKQNTAPAIDLQAIESAIEAAIEADIAPPPKELAA